MEKYTNKGRDKFKSVVGDSVDIVASMIKTRKKHPYNSDIFDSGYL